MPQAPVLPFSGTRRAGERVLPSGKLPLGPEGIEAQTAPTLKCIVGPRPVRTTVRADLMLPGALRDLTVVASRAR